MIAHGIEVFSAERIRANRLDKSPALLFREKAVGMKPRGEIHFRDGAEEKARLRDSVKDARMFLHVQRKEFFRAAPCQKALRPALCAPTGI